MPRYANITATLALFVALGGTATAAVTLERDSVTAREIARNAVGHQEIRPEAVRSSELEDETIALGDLADRTRRELQGTQGPQGPQGPAGPAGPSGTSQARFTEDDEADVASCPSIDLTDCQNVQSVLLTEGNWAVHAKFTAFGALGIGNACGLVVDDASVADHVSPLATPGANTMQVSLADVITVAEPTRVAVRCSEFVGDLELLSLKLVAISVDEVVVF